MGKTSLQSQFFIILIQMCYGFQRSRWYKLRLCIRLYLAGVINPQIQFRRNNRSVASTTVNLWIQNGIHAFNFFAMHGAGQSKFIPFENVKISSQEHAKMNLVSGSKALRTSVNLTLFKRFKNLS